jgi:hypothetical protein
MLMAVAMACLPGSATAAVPGKPAIREAATSVAATPAARVQAAVERAASRHVPGARGRGWVLHQLDQSDPRADGTRRIVARGLLGTPGDPGTHVKMTGIYDPEGDVLRRVSYELKAPAQPKPPRDTDLAPAWTVQGAVQQAMADAAADPSARFALDSAQSLRLEDGGRRFEGVGIGRVQGGEAMFVSFTLELSRDGETVGFDYGPRMPVADSTTELAAEY